MASGSRTTNVMTLLPAVVFLVLFVVAQRYDGPRSPAAQGEPGVALQEESAGETAPLEYPPLLAEGRASTEQRVAGESERVPTWAVWLLVLLACTAAVSVSISFYLYRWRRILLAQPNTVVPEEWAKYLGSLGRQVDGVAEAYKRSIGELTLQTSQAHQTLENMVETSMTLHKALDERDAEIARLKRGYDAHIFRKFLLRFLRVDMAVDGFIRAEDVTPETLGHVRRILEDAFAECGVETFEPEIGADYRKTDGVADAPRTLAADHPDQDFTIAEVLERGYRLQNAQGYEVVQEAKVRIFRTET